MAWGTRFIGRQEVEDHLLDVLDNERIVTLTGPGGIGKTRLAHEIASRRSDSDQATALIELAPATPGDDLEMTFARQLGQPSLDAFAVGLDGTRAIVVLDNCEHVLADAASLSARLVEHPDLAVLATSRAPLGLPGEVVVKLDPLETSGHDHNHALRLFLDRAGRAGATWLDMPEQQTAAAEIVRHLDGVPLAIELAAARSRVLAPTDLLSMLPRQLDLLTDDARDASASPTRRDLRSVVQTSYGPLGAACQRTFRTLSVIPHGADLELVRAMTGSGDPLTTLDELTELVDQSLVYTAPGPGGGVVYRLLEPVRAFGLEQLDGCGERHRTIDRYVDAVCEFADRIVVATATSFSADLLDQITQQYVHLLQAIEFTLEIDDGPDRAYRLLLPLYSPTKGPRREQALLAARLRERWPDSPDRFRAAAYAIMAHIALWAGTDDPTPFAREALDDPGATRIAKIIAYRVLAFHAGRLGEREAARLHIEDALETAASRGGSFERELRMSWASLVDDPARVPEAIEIAKAMSLAASESGETVTVVWAASVCVHQHLRRDEIREARLTAEHAGVFAERSTSPWPVASAARTLGFVCAAEGDWGHACRQFATAFETVVTAGDIEGVTLTARSAAISAQQCGEPDLARQLWTAVPTRYKPTSLPPLFVDAEAELVRRHGEPLPIPLGDAVRSARDVLESDRSEAAVTDRRGDIDAATQATDDGGDDDHTIYRFNGFELDTRRRELRHDGVDVHLEPQVFDVLVRLADDAGNLVTKEQLLDDVWGSRFVSPSALTSRIKSARAATGDDGKAQRVVRTIHGRGFMFVAEME